MAQSDSPQNRRTSPDDAPTVIDEELYSPPSAPTTANDDAPTQRQGTPQSTQEESAASGKNSDNEKTVISHRSPGAPAWTGPSTSAELGAMLEGQRLGHFVLEEFVGGGGMGAVFRGRDELLGRIVAVKVLPRDQGADPETLRRFKNEAQSAARLDHENIARVFFVGEDEGWNFIVFEFIDGTNLREVVEQDGPLSLDLALDYTIQVAEALDHAAERDVVHRDIKPSNVLVTKDGFVKLVDMGLARLHQMEAGHSDLTASGVTLGTFDYISPEQASDPRRADVRSDLYSLGCTLFFMLTGRPPFPHGTVLQKLLAHSGEVPPDARELRPDMPDELQKILARLLAKRPEQRYEWPSELIAQLLDLRDRLGMASVSAASRIEHLSTGLSWRKRALAWGIPLAMICLFVLGWEWLLSGGYSAANNPPEFRIPAQHGAAVAPRVNPSMDTDAGQKANPASNGLDSAVKRTPSAGDTTDETQTPSTSATDNTTEPAIPSVGSADDGSNGGSSKDTSATDTGESSSASSKTTDSRGSDSSSLGSTGEPAPSSPAVDSEAVRVLIVGDAAQIGDLGPHVRMFSTLSAALASEEFLNEHSAVRTIEVRSPRTVEPRPLRVALPEGRELTIRGATNTLEQQLPVVLFDAPLRKPASDDLGMIEVESGKLKIENLHLRLTTGETMTAGDLSLLRLRAGDVKDVDLQSCILTIENRLLDDSGRITFIDVVVPANSMEMPTRLPIDLKDCIVRGAANMVRMRNSVPMKLKWENGLLAITERLLLTYGSSRPWEETIGVSLTHVTVSTGQGLCRLRDSIQQPHQPALELECNECVISAGSSTLVEHDGVGDVEKFRKALFVSGSTNYFEGVTDFWRVYVDNIEQEELNWDWATWKDKMMLRGGMPSKLTEIRWQRDRTDVPSTTPHLCGLDDFLPDPESDNPVNQVEPMPAGLNADSLPALYRIAPTREPAAEEALSTTPSALESS